MKLKILHDVQSCKVQMKNTDCKDTFVDFWKGKTLKKLHVI